MFPLELDIQKTGKDVAAIADILSESKYRPDSLIFPFFRQTVSELTS